MEKLFFSVFVKQDPEDKANILFVDYDAKLKNFLFNSDVNDNNRFRELFDLGFEYYIKGRWRESREILKAGLKIKKHDGPSRVLVDYMKRYFYVVPHDWKGYRLLADK